jgi:hypothetical protein
MEMDFNCDLMLPDDNLMDVADDFSADATQLNKILENNFSGNFNFEHELSRNTAAFEKMLYNNGSRDQLDGYNFLEEPTAEKAMKLMKQGKSFESFSFSFLISRLYSYRKHIFATCSMPKLR